MPAMLGALLLASAAAAPRVTTKGTQFVDSASGEPVVLVGANVSRSTSVSSRKVCCSAAPAELRD